MKARNISLDILRSIAIFFVIAQHFMLHSDFYIAGYKGLSLYIQTFFLTVFMSAIPIFVMLSGFLNCSKTISYQYYGGGKKVLSSFLFYAILSILFKQYILNENLSFPDILFGISSLQIVRYSWYIDMWIGLFLLTPFLNILYNGIEDKSIKLLLIFILGIISILPETFNRVGVKIFPDYWHITYPLFFYFIGAFFREYQPFIKRKYLLGLITFIAFCNVFINIVLSAPHFVNYMGGPGTIFNAFISFSIFLMLYHIEIKNKWIVKASKRISMASLDMYLGCAMFDMLLYPYFKQKYFESQSQFGQFFFIIVPTVFLLSYILAQVKKLVFGGLKRLF